MSGRKKKFDGKTFAIKDKQGNISVAIEVLLYKSTDEGYEQLNKKFPDKALESQTETVEALTLDEGWVIVEPQNTQL